MSEMLKYPMGEDGGGLLWCDWLFLDEERGALIGVINDWRKQRPADSVAKVEVCFVLKGIVNMGIWCETSRIRGARRDRVFQLRI